MWSLVNLVETELTYDRWEGEYPDVKNVLYTVKAAPGTIFNIIEYDGESKYEVPENFELLKVDDSARIGDLHANYKV